MQPKVQSIADIIKSQTPIYQKGIDAITKYQKGLPVQYQAQVAGIDAAKTQGFNLINDQATGKGTAFSGIPQDEMATYLSTKYLPALVGLKQQQNDQNFQLEQALAAIDKERRLGALSIQQQQQASLEDWLKSQAQQKLSYAQMASSNSSNNNYFTKTTNNGGTAFYDPNGNPITAAQYFSANGGGPGDLINFLKQDGDPTSKVAYDYLSNNGLQAAKSKYPYIFGGV